jgi:tRNA threonylcarbamoyl adenosine modification protein YeaZ
MARTKPLFALALETSARTGSVALGKDDRLLQTRDLATPRRHHVELMPAVDALCHEQRIAPNDLSHLYVAIGPGSFTGLRIAAASAQILAFVLDLQLVAVPSIDTIAANVTPDVLPAPHAALAVVLNVKADTSYCGVYRRTPDALQWASVLPAALRSTADLLQHAPRPLAILGDPLPDALAAAIERESDLHRLDAALARPHAQQVFHLGRAMALRHEFTAPDALLPLYAREPEAVTLWRQRHG